jgi:hypothetical protein
MSATLAVTVKNKTSKIDLMAGNFTHQPQIWRERKGIGYIFVA